MCWEEKSAGESRTVLQFWAFPVFVPVVVGTDETGAALATTVNITYKLVVTHTELEILGLIKIRQSI